MITKINGVYSLTDEADVANLPTKGVQLGSIAQLTKDNGDSTVYIFTKDMSTGNTSWVKVPEDDSIYATDLSLTGTSLQLKNSNDEVIGNSIDLSTSYQLKTDSSLNTTDKTIVGAINETFQYVSDGKNLIASAITDSGIMTSNEDTFETMATNIRILSGGNDSAYAIDFIVDTESIIIEENDTKLINIKLNNPPDSNIEVSLSTSNQFISLLPNVITFTKEDYLNFKTIKVTAMNQFKETLNDVITISANNVNKKEIKVELISKETSLFNSILPPFEEWIIQNPQYATITELKNGNCILESNEETGTPHLDAGYFYKGKTYKLHLDSLGDNNARFQIYNNYWEIIHDISFADFEKEDYIFTCLVDSYCTAIINKTERPIKCNFKGFTVSEVNPGQISQEESLSIKLIEPELYNIYDDNDYNTDFFNYKYFDENEIEILDGIHLYLSASGDDVSGDGTKTSPWKSINKARQYVDSLSVKPTKVNVWLADGDYNINETQIIKGNYFGTQMCPVDIRGLGNKANLTTGTELTNFTIVNADLSPGGVQCYAYDLTNIEGWNTGYNIFDPTLKDLPHNKEQRDHGTGQGNITDMPFVSVNGQRLWLASYPQKQDLLRPNCNGTIKGEPFISTTSITINNTETGLINKLSEFSYLNSNSKNRTYLQYWWDVDYYGETQLIKSYDTQTHTIFTTGKSYKSQNNISKTIKMKFFNIKEQLNEESTYWIDFDNNMLYLIPANGTDMNTAKVVLSHKKISNDEYKNCIIATNTNEKTYVTFERINFIDHRCNVFLLAENNKLDGVNFYKCLFKNIGRSAIGCHVSYGYRGTGITDLMQNCNIMQCKFSHTGEATINIIGANRAVSSLYSDNNKIYNCIFNYNSCHGVIIDNYSPAIFYYGVGMEIKGCKFANNPGIAVRFIANDLIIERNIFYQNCWANGDTGNTYCGMNWTFRGIKIHNNLFRGGDKQVDRNVGVGTCGVYFDDSSSSGEITNNTFENMQKGMLIGGGRDHIIKNNLIRNCDYYIRYDYRKCKAATIMFSNIVPFENWTSKYPAISTLKRMTTNQAGNTLNAIPYGSTITHNRGIGSTIADKWSIVQTVYNNSTVTDNSTYNNETDVGCDITAAPIIKPGDFEEHPLPYVTKFMIAKTNNGITFGFKYDENTNLQIDFVKAGGNDLPHFSHYYKINSSALETDLSIARTAIMNVATDYLMPYQVKALNNPLNSRSSTWTGGYHGAEGTNFNKPGSAINISWQLFVNDKEVTTTQTIGTITDNAKMIIKNEVGAYNTIDTTNYAGNGGRMVLIETITITFHANHIEIHNKITAKEDIQFNTLYGIADMFVDLGADAKIKFIGSNDESEKNIPSSSGEIYQIESGTKNSGDQCYKILAKNNEGDIRELYLNTSYGIGNRAYLSDNSPCSMVSKWRKGYMNMVNSGNLTLLSGESVEFKGGWKIYNENANIPEDIIADEKISVEYIDIVAKESEIKVGENMALQYIIYPSNSTNKQVIWTSDDTSIATVIDGNVTGKSAGQTIIRAITKDGEKTDSISITVTPIDTTDIETIPVQLIYLKTKSFNMNVGETFQLDWVINPSNATDKSVYFTTPTPKIVTVSETGLVTALSSGTGKVLVHTNDGGFTSTATITIS